MKPIPMRKLQLFALTFFGLFTMYAQQTLIPDANFEQALIDLGHDDVLDGEVLTANISGITGLVVINKNISDLTGIEDFTALETLNCSNNNLSDLNVSNNANLEFLNAINNNLTSLDVSNNLLLDDLRVSINNLTTLDVSNNIHLNVLVVSNNLLTSLDLSNNPELITINCDDNQLISLSVKSGGNTTIGSFIADNNPNLFCIEVDDPVFSEANWTGTLFSFDSTASFNEDCTVTLIPDANFEQALIDLGHDNVLDGQVITANISGITELIVVNKNISDLTGIEDFTALEALNCSNNNLSDLNVSNNLNLINLVCNNNALTTIGVSNNILLENLNVSNNNLTALDVSQNEVLTSLRCTNNQITELDVSNNLALVTLTANINQLTSLDLSNNPELSTIFCNDNQLTSLSVKSGGNANITGFFVQTNPGLTCIEVDDATFSIDNWTGGSFSFDETVGFSEDCANAFTAIPDENFEQALIDAGHDNVLDGQVFTANISGITGLFVSGENISDLTGIEDFNALQTLNCSFNNLSDLNVSNNLNLINLVCNDNALTTIDVSNNASLEFLDVTSNNLTSLDVSNNLLLDDLRVINNNLTTIDVSNNANLVGLLASGNNLTTLDVSNNLLLDDLQVANNNLTSLDVSNNPVLTNLNCINNQITELDVSNNPVLEVLLVNNNQLTSLDLSNNPELFDIICSNNQLTSLSVKSGGNANIIGFRAQNNPNLFCIEVDDPAFSETNWTGIFFVFDPASSFSEDCTVTLIPDANFEQALIDLGHDDVLDGQVFTINIRGVPVLDVENKNIADLTGIEDFTDLINLNVRQNNLTALDVSNNTALEELNFRDNQLTTIDVSNNTTLLELISAGNPLASLDVSNNLLLESLNVSDNNLISLDLGNNSVLDELLCKGNALTALDLSNNLVLTRLACFQNQLTSLNVKNGNNVNMTLFTATSNPDLLCIEVDDTAFSNANWTDGAFQFDETASFSEDCTVTLIPDANFEQALIDLGHDNVIDGQVFTINISGITQLNLNNNGTIADVTGIEDFVALEVLSLFNNNLTEINISNNTALKSLNVGTNSITALDVSANLLLEQLIVSSNDLTELDVSNNLALTALACFNNQLTSLNVKNGNNVNMTLFTAENNPNLSCIEVDDVAFSENNWTSGNFTFDETVSFSEDCGSLSIDDNQFFNPKITLINGNVLMVSDIVGTTKLKIYNMLGKNLLQEHLKPSSKHYLELNLNAGLYIVKLEANGVQITKKIIVH